MLVVQRKVGERIVVGGGIEITLVATARGGARLAVRAPKDVWVARGEVYDAIAQANEAAAATASALLEHGAPEEDPTAPRTVAEVNTEQAR